MALTKIGKEGITGISNSSDANAITIDSSENVGIGETSPLGKLHVKSGDSGASVSVHGDELVVEGSANSGISILSGNSNTGVIYFGDDGDNNVAEISYDHSANAMKFFTNASERMRINSVGQFTFGTTNLDPAQDNQVGISFSSNGSGSNVTGVGQFSCNGAVAIRGNRTNEDGVIIAVHQAGTQEGTISISGSTTSYNAFSGSHWSRFTDNSKPTILKGTVIETIDEMCDWYQIKFTVPATEEEEYTPRIPYALQDGQSVGDTVTYNHNGTDYQATIVKEGDNKHTKCKISDTADSTRVYGVFADWDNDDDTVNDMYVTAVGTHVVRVNQDETVSAGDLLVSNGDGTAKVQDDDIIRSKTIGKVLTNIKQETYDDGSYIVPCALYCG